MQFSTLLTVAYTLAQATHVMGHGIVSDLKVGDTWYKGSNPFQDPSVQGGVKRIVWSFYKGGNGPVEDIKSDDIVCNAGAKAAALTAPVDAGAKIDLDWTEWPSSHKGPVMTYLANCEGKCTDATPSKLKWFKIDEGGYDSSSDTWATDDLIKNNNSWTVTVPDKLKTGNYLLRHEILALHSAGSSGGAQFYPMCANLKVTGSGSAEPSSSDTVSFPGAYKASDPGILVNIYNGLSSYKIPGPSVWGGSSSSSSSGSSSKSQSGSDSTESASESAANPVAAAAVPAKSSAEDNNAAASTQASPDTETSATSADAGTNSAPTGESSSGDASSGDASGDASPSGDSSSGNASSGDASSGDASSGDASGDASPSGDSSSGNASSGNASSGDSSSGDSSSGDSSSGDSSDDYNTCMDKYNKCLDAAQPKSGGSAKLGGCSNKCSQTKK